jgi:hypothetical protein
VALNVAGAFGKLRHFPGRTGQLATRITKVEGYILDWESKLASKAFEQLPSDLRLRGRAIVRLLSSKTDNLATKYFGGLSASDREKVLYIKRPLMSYIRVHLMNKLQAMSEKGGTDENTLASGASSQRILDKMIELIATIEGSAPNEEHAIIAKAISLELGLIE